MVSSRRFLIAGGAFLFLVVAGCAGGAPETDAGSNGDGSSMMGCSNAKKIFSDHLCTTVCHMTATASTYGGFDMTTPGWEKNLIGKGPPDNAPATNMCKGKGLVYLKPNVQPATGLFLDKLRPNPPCGVIMPMTPPVLTSSEIDCVQKWANSIVAGGNGG